MATICSTIPGTRVRALVQQSCDLSVDGLLTTFVTGRTAPDHEVAIFELLPFAIEAPEEEPWIARPFVHKPKEITLEPIDAINREAWKDFVFHVSYSIAGSFQHATITQSTVGVRFSWALPHTTIDPYLTTGVTLAPGIDGGAWMVGGGVRIPFAISHRGIFSHEIDVGLQCQPLSGSFIGSLHGAYRFNIELARLLVTLTAGPAQVYPSLNVGYFGGIGLGWVAHASGGGVLVW
jgi:hypothetical protein